MVLYNCNRCDKQFTNKYDFNRHINRKNPCPLKVVHVPISILCINCGQAYDSNKSLNRHIRRSCLKNKITEDILKSNINDEIATILKNNNQNPPINDINHENCVKIEQDNPKNISSMRFLQNTDEIKAIDQAIFGKGEKQSFSPNPICLFETHDGDLTVHNHKPVIEPNNLDEKANTITELYICQYCDKSYTFKHNLTRHMIKCKVKTIIDEKDKINKNLNEKIVTLNEQLNKLATHYINLNESKNDKINDILIHKNNLPPEKKIIIREKIRNLINQLI